GLRPCGGGAGRTPLTGTAVPLARCPGGLISGAHYTGWHHQAAAENIPAHIIIKVNRHQLLGRGIATVQGHPDGPPDHRLRVLHGLIDVLLCWLVRGRSLLVDEILHQVCSKVTLHLPPILNLLSDTYES